MIDYGHGGIPILPLNIACDIYHNTLRDCLQSELNVEDCTQVAGIDCKGIIILNTYRSLIILRVFLAPCVTKVENACDDCSDDDYYFDYYTYMQCVLYNRHFDYCSCHSKCFLDGECCSDISVAHDKCYGKNNYLYNVM